MSTWILPAAAAAAWMGILAGSALPAAWPAWGGAAAGLAALGVAALMAPGPAPDLLEAAGILIRRQPPAAVAVAPPPAGRGRGPPLVVALVGLVALAALGGGLEGMRRQRLEGSLLARIAPAWVRAVGSMRTDPRPGRFGWSAVVDVSRVEWVDGSFALREPVWVRGDDEPVRAVRGDRVELAGRILLPDEGFGGFLHDRGIVVELGLSEIRRLGPSGSRLVRAAQSVRRALGSSIGRLFGDREGGLLLGLSLGDDRGLDPELHRDFRATGLSHLLVVSGGNVAMVLAPILGLLALLRAPASVRLAVGIGTVGFFTLLTGMEPSVLRAGLMAAMGLLGIYLGRPRSTGSTLGATVLVLLLLDPALARNVGFGLSVAATAGMVALATPIARRMWFLPRPMALAAGATVGAQAGVAPLLLAFFREVPLVTLPANVLAFPAVSPALLLGLSAAGLDVVVPGSGRVPAAAAGVPLRYLEAVADRLATAPGPWVTSEGGTEPLLLVGGLVVAAGWWLRSGRRPPRPALVAGAAALALFVWSTAIRAGPPSGLEVRFFDVGQGDAALVLSPGGASVLIDGGPDPGRVATKLAALGVKRLDAVVATHPHADHVQGLPAVVGRFPVGLVLEPGCREPSPAYEEFVEAIMAEGLRVLHPRTGQTVTAGDLRLDVLSPPGCYSGTESDANNDSLVIRLSLGEDVVLFAGDAEEPAQQAILDAGEALQADLLKVPHHGGGTSLAAFFDAVDADLAVVSVGENDYGHPVARVLVDLRATGARVLRTDRMGDVTVLFSPEGLLVASAAS